VLRTIELVRDEAGPDGTAAKKLLLRPHGVQFVGADRVLVTSELARRLALVDIGTGSVLRSWTTPQASMHMVAVTSDLRRAVATSLKDGNAALFDLGSDAAPTIVPSGSGAEGLAIDPRTGEAWIGNREADTLVVLGADGEPSAPIATADFPFRVAFAPDGSAALVACAEAGVVQVFDAKAKTLKHEIDIATDASELSPMPMGLVVDPDGRFAYVCCGRGEFVAVLDLAAQRVVERIPARAGPDGIGYARLRGTGS
jgi:DNA-binding beta-propeller fold protein YncE